MKHLFAMPKNGLSTAVQRSFNIDSIMNERRTGILLPRVNRRESALTLFERGDRRGGVGGYGGFQWGR